MNQEAFRFLRSYVGTPWQTGFQDFAMMYRGLEGLLRGDRFGRWPM